MSKEYEATRREYQELMSVRVAETQQRLSWPVEDRRSFTNDRLREFLAFAASRSRWHRARLADIDLDAVSIDDMSSLPTMSKRDLNDNWDAIVTDPDLTLGRGQPSPRRHVGERVQFRPRPLRDHGHRGLDRSQIGHRLRCRGHGRLVDDSGPGQDGRGNDVR